MVHLLLHQMATIKLWHEAHKDYRYRTAYAEKCITLERIGDKTSKTCTRIDQKTLTEMRPRLSTRYICVHTVEIPSCSMYDEIMVINPHLGGGGTPTSQAPSVCYVF